MQDTEKVKLLRKAIERHGALQLAAREGKGIDRHLFGLWCAAFVNDLDIPELYDDPMYSKSGGGGNFVLSTSTLGFTINNGFVGPMLPDGYGAFYTITSDRFAFYCEYSTQMLTNSIRFLPVFG